MNHYTHLYGKAVIYLWHEPLHGLVWKHSDLHELYKEYVNLTLTTKTVKETITTHHTLAWLVIS